MNVAACGTSMNMNTSTQDLAERLALNTARIRYLAMAAACISDNSTPIGQDQVNCIGYLLSTIEFFGELASDLSEKIEVTTRIEAMQQLQRHEEVIPA